MKITSENNFCRIFELPISYPEGFCFGGGKQVLMLMVDWFNPIPVTDIWTDTVKPWSEYAPLLLDFLRKKEYVMANRRYLLVTDFDEAVCFTKEEQ